MPNPLREAIAFLDAEDVADQLPDGTTYDAEIPTTLTTHPHIQIAWDGSPTDADNRESTAIRFTVWMPRGQGPATADLAEVLRADFMLWSSDNAWRVNRGAGRLPGIDPDTKLPFCSFTVNVQMKAVTPVL